MKKILNNPLGMKFAFMLFLFLLVQIPISMVSELISERSHRQEEVIQDIARSSSGEQHIIGPFIMVEHQETSFYKDKKKVKKRSIFLLPDTFDMNANLDSFEKYRGIYRAPLYKAQVTLKGAFKPETFAVLNNLDINRISLVVGIEDSRGLVRLDQIKLDSSDIEIQPGTGLTQIPQGFHSELNMEIIKAQQTLTFDIHFLLQGMRQLKVTPIGNQTTVELSSNWAHPSFIGDYLPISSDVSEDGFKAQWASNNFSTNIAQRIQRCLSSNKACQKLEQRQMGVELIDPVNHYLKSHRAVNYSQLVILLVFVSFFLLELFQARPFHPIQYGFIGLALAIFYLLLISLSEHLGFNWAYLLSTLASTSLLTIYVRGMLNSVKQAIVFSICLLVLYGLLFGLLLAESYALVMGALLCFAILSFTMFITRHIDWYARNTPLEEKTSSGEA
jgi:inner membrane protein